MTKKKSEVIKKEVESVGLKEDNMREGGLRIQGGFKKSYGERPLVSIITVVYNDTENLEMTIKSVITQKYDNIEYIVIDGGSTYNTLEVIKKYETQIDYWISECDQGIYDAMNKGIAEGRGEYFTFLNAGDIYCNSHTIKKIQKSMNEKHKIIYGNHIAVDQGNKQYKKSGVLSIKNLIQLGTKVVCHQSMFVHKSVLVDYSLDYVLKGELKWYLEMLRVNQDMLICRVDFPIVYYDKAGLGEQKKFLNLIEFVQVVYSEYGIPGAIQTHKVVAKMLIQIIVKWLKKWV